MTDPLAIQQTFETFVDFILKYAITLAALGALTVGLLEAYKKLFSTLAKFQRDAVVRWLTQEAPTPPAANQLMSSIRSGGHYGVAPNSRAKDARRKEPYDGVEAYAELLHLTTGVLPENSSTSVSSGGGPFKRSVSFALFELELAKMMAQIQEAADAALNNPARYGNWFRFLTRGCDDDDIAKWLSAMTLERPLNGPIDSPESRQREELAEVYARIRLLMRRQLDSFQTITSYRWKEWNQLWAWGVGAVLLMLAQVIQAALALEPGSSLSWLRLGTMGFASLAGGILAPIAKDLVDALGKVKSGG